MHAILLSGEAQLLDDKIQEITKKYPKRELFKYSAQISYSIDEVREIIRLVQRSLPEKTTRIIVIKAAEKMTPEAANSFLKTLEEPLTRTLFILTAQNTELVLETIRSRCQIIELASRTDFNPTQDELELYEKLLSGNLGQRLSLVDTYPDRQKAIDFCTNLIKVARKKTFEKLGSGEAGRHSEIIKNAQESIFNLKLNVNPKIALTSLFLKFT